MGGCHLGNPLEFDTGTVKVYAGGTNRNGGWTKMETVPDLAIGPIGVIRSAHTRDIVPDGWSCKSAIISNNVPSIIEIDWPDFGIPDNFGKEFWIALVNDIKEKGIKTISCQCMGGHGRTGVQLAILAHLLIPTKDLTWKDAGELITHLREMYCENIVESKVQQKYVAEVCDIPEGESIVEVSKKSIWDGMEFDTHMTEDELQAWEKKEAAKEKKKRKKTEGAEFKKKNTGSPKNHFTAYETPIHKGWCVIFCPSCHHYKWRRANKKAMESPCNCGHEVFQVDKEVLEHKMERCIETGYTYHPLEMYDMKTSKLAMAEAMEMDTKVQSNVEFIKTGGKWYPAAFFVVQEDGSMITALQESQVKKPTLEEYTKPSGFKFKKKGRKTDEEIEADDSDWS